MSKQSGICKHCGGGPLKLTSRGLCWKCSADSAVRKRYPIPDEVWERKRQRNSATHRKLAAEKQMHRKLWKRPLQLNPELVDFNRITDNPFPL
jgi:hypothetical protein